MLLLTRCAKDWEMRFSKKHCSWEPRRSDTARYDEESLSAPPLPLRNPRIQPLSPLALPSRSPFSLFRAPTALSPNGTPLAAHEAKALTHKTLQQIPRPANCTVNAPRREPSKLLRSQRLPAFVKNVNMRCPHDNA